MGGRILLFQLGDTPVYANATIFILLLFCFISYGTSPLPQSLALGFIYALGVLVSILLHEFGHSLVARQFGIKTNAIELHGLGGFCHLARSPKLRWQSIAISIAGPLVNLGLYWVARHELLSLMQTSITIDPSGNPTAGTPLPHALLVAIASFATANFIMFVFNMLPAFPLDGGRALRNFLGYLMRDQFAIRIIAILGMLIGALTLLSMLQFGIGIIFVGLYLLFENYQAFQDAK
ncbi:MAG: site-2 protease family protein [Hyphomicrobiales bacterium]|nr:site-2 protease family protein [Hyphomicrobiales bacterium]MDE2115818.1 site-2 protease family protein [Hyphomicrobiales bacterium]